jgi:ribosomal protein S18 acetylase RimI-like enzyme
LYDIRPATVADAAIVTVHRHRMFLAMGRPDDERLRAMTTAFLPWVRGAIRDGRYLGLLATSADTVAAGAGMLVLDWPPGPNDPGCQRAYLLNVYTEPEHRRRGLARRLVQAALDEARVRGIRVVALHASAEGRSLYESLGFQSTNEMYRIEP